MLGNKRTFVYTFSKNYQFKTNSSFTTIFNKLLSLKHHLTYHLFAKFKRPTLWKGDPGFTIDMILLVKHVNKPTISTMTDGVVVGSLPFVPLQLVSYDE